MKIKLILVTVLLLSPLAQQISAQTTPSTQVQVKPTVTPAKKWVPKAKTTNTAGQVTTADTVKNTDLSLNGQYQFLLSRSRSVNGYKLMNPFRLSTVWKSAMDTVAAAKSDLFKANAKIIAQADTINTLRATVKGTELEVKDTNSKIDEINILGLSLSKGTYNVIVWSIILILGISLFIVIARSAKNINEAKHRTQLYDEIAAEYQNYKSKASEKERKLARELQDERNIVEELKNSMKS
jgi:hypothetical protein